LAPGTARRSPRQSQNAILRFAHVDDAEEGAAAVAAGIAAVPVAAAIDAGFTRFRPVLMTALAMVVGMLPMAFALGKGGEQNAPLGRAVIGGLLVATCATLFFVPAVFALLQRNDNVQRTGEIAAASSASST
jgi:multidrug efflux pump subunit AcrB